MAALAFCVGAAYWPGIYSGFAQPKWWAMAIGLAVIPWGFRNLDPIVMACAAAGLLMAALSLLLSPHVYGATLQLIFMILLCGVAGGSAALDDVGPVIAALSGGVAVSVAASVLQFFGWWIAPHSGYAGLYLNTEVMGELAAPLFIWAFWRKSWVLAGIMGTSIALCHSRVAVFTAVCGLLYGWSAPRRVKIICIAVLMLAAIGAVFMAGQGKDISGLSRIMLWGAALLSMVPSGHGLLWWSAAHPFPMEEFVHSDVLQLMVEIGVGSVFFLAIPFMVLQRGGGVAERAAYIGICLEALVSFPMHLPATGFLAAVLTGHLARSRVGVLVSQSERGMEGRGAVRWPAPSGRSLAWWHGRRGVDLPDRPAYPQPEGFRPTSCEGAT